MEHNVELPSIIVRGSGGKTAQVRVVDETEDTYYVVSEREYQDSRASGEAVHARLGFPKADAVKV